MKLVVGLGNPGRQYADTRHNLGYRVVEGLAERWQFSGWKEKFHSLVAEGPWRGDRVCLLRPLTYMNDSGKAVLAAGRFYRCELADLLVVSDDLDLPLGKLRIRAQGSSGGQRGLEDVIARLGSNAFARLRIGVGRPARGDVRNFLLEPFAASERAAAAEAVRQACDAVECWLSEGTTGAMNRYNRAPPPGDEPDGAAQRKE